MISGLHIQYYFVCHRKLWLYSKNLGLEEGHERVIEGTLLHERSYKSADQKEIAVDHMFRIDALEGEYVREVKISSKMTDADKYQLLFYLYQLKKRGLTRKGLISYTKEKKTEEVVLTEEDEKKIEEIEAKIKEIILSDAAPKLVRKPYCRKCAYFDFCFASEEEEL